MTLGKIYYLANVLDKINGISWILFIISSAISLIMGIFYLSGVSISEEEDRLWRKIIKIFSIAFCLSTILVVVTPNKEDFLFMSITKDYTPQQIHTMTKEEIKNGIDYIVEQINKIKQ